MWEDSFRFTRCKDQLRRTGEESFDSLRTLNFLVFPSVKTHKNWQISWLLHLNWPWPLFMHRENTYICKKEETAKIPQIFVFKV